MDTASVKIFSKKQCRKKCCCLGSKNVSVNRNFYLPSYKDLYLSSSVLVICEMYAHIVQLPWDPSCTDLCDLYMLWSTMVCITVKCKILFSVLLQLHLHLGKALFLFTRVHTYLHTHRGESKLNY